MSDHPSNPAPSAGPAPQPGQGSPSTQAEPPIVLGEPGRANGPPGFEITSIAVEGIRILVGGHQGESRTPYVWAGVLGAGAIHWTTRIPVHTDQDGDVDYAPELALDASAGGTRLAVGRLGEHWNCSLLVLEEAEGRWSRVEVIPPWRESGARGFESGYGKPVILRGGQLFTLANPGSDIRNEPLDEASSALLQFQKEAGRWHGTQLPFAPTASDLWWGLSLSPDGSTLVLTTEHHGGAYHLDVYRRESGAFRVAQSIRLPDTPSDIVFSRSRIVVAGRALLVLRLAEAGWSEERRIKLPESAGTAAGVGTHLTLFASLDHLVVRRADRRVFWVNVDQATVREIPIPESQVPRDPRLMAMDNVRLFAVLRGEIRWWTFSQTALQP
ncbi:MAG: hypothetical protein HY904_14790 [Deltaproteobacteria bacterium]|nr:hypothetical protein [Deltaproteobacteria bacterium]